MPQAPKPCSRKKREMLPPTTVISLFYRDAIKSTRDEVKPDIVAPNLPDGARTSESRRDADRESEEGEHLLCEAQAATHPERESAATTGLQGCVEARIDLSTSLRRLGDGQLPWGHGSHGTLDFLTTASKS